MRFWRAVGAGACAVVALSACAGPDLPLLSKPAAKMDGHDISMSDYNARLQLYQALYRRQNTAAGASPGAQPSPPGAGKLEDRAINDLVDEQLIRDDAAANHVSVGDNEVQMALDNAHRDFQTTIDKAKIANQSPPATSFDDYLKSFGYTADSFKDQLRQRLFEQKLENKLAETRLAAANADLKAGTAFEEVAKKWSDDPSSSGKGGLVTLKQTDLDHMDQLVKPALDRLQPGTTSSEAARGVNGYYLFKVLSRDANGVGLDVIYISAPNLAYYRTSQRAQWFTDHLTELENKAHIHYNVGTKAS